MFVFVCDMQAAIKQQTAEDSNLFIRFAQESARLSSRNRVEKHTAACTRQGCANGHPIPGEVCNQRHFRADNSECSEAYGIRYCKPAIEAARIDHSRRDQP